MPMGTEQPWLPDSEDVQRLKVAGYRCVHGVKGFFARRDQRLLISAALRLIIIRRLLMDQRNRCYYCEDQITEKSATLEHKQPISRNGTWKRYNLAAACAFCNKAKADLTEAEFWEIAVRHTFNGPRNRSVIRNAAKFHQSQRNKLNSVARQSARLERQIPATALPHMAMDVRADIPVDLAHE